MERSYSPIQVVLDVRRFQDERIRDGGGGAKEFFEGNDQGFKEHKKRIQESLRSVGQALRASRASSLGFVRVRMREEALAKSHRPVQNLFHPSYAPTIGSSDVGELIIQVSPLSVERALSESEKAETTLAFKESKKKPGKMEANPSRARSEVGAIESISLWAPPDRRGFDIKDAIKWFESHAVSRGYRVDLFDPQMPGQRRVKEEFAEAGNLSSHLLNVLDEKLDCGYVATIFRPDPKSMSRMYIWLFDDASIRHIVASAHVGAVLRDVDEPTLAVGAHKRLISVLEAHPAVRRISLPMLLRAATPPTARASADSGKRKHRFSLPVDGANYPTVGIIDGGLTQLPPDWVRHSSAYLHPSHADKSHGTEIGALLIDGQRLNNPTVCPEPDGCWIADLAIMPIETKFDDYYRSDLDLINQIDQEVQEAKASAGARIFSFSHNIEEPPGGNPIYTELSHGLDRIAKDSDVIFVVSAGNTKAGSGRSRREWASDKVAVLTNLASCTGDRITAPADSVLNIAVAALNPPDVPGTIAGAPARYSRRGPGFMQLVKPDVAHYGGVCDSTNSSSGLSTVGESGHVKTVFGTSFSTPLVAKALARIDLVTQGALPREALVALLVHGARAPACLDGYDKGDIVRNFVGFGLPTPTEQMVNGSEHAATLLFYDRMMPKKDLFFGFDWPQSLVENGKCRGHAMLTLVYAPPISDSFETELVRLNLDASIQQMQPSSGKFKPQCADTFSDGSVAVGAREKELIEDGLKWGVVKQSQYFSAGGKGKSSDWRIALKYLLRSDEVFPEDGVPFAMILTITDPDGAAPVYQDMKVALSARQVFTGDIRQPAGQIQARGGRSAG
ncbi:S8 family peptidase [Burkholderia pseudomallei]|uniref:S8 family peptidase n=1 Tax=Burkholderia pseudomallei TaxID=28450 RepID=UPI000F078E61|nr:S8 family peptidase [Burkholderia pseudomallei]VBP13364.1 Uncharacterised protein [Burkholderia pseudomallei]